MNLIEQLFPRARAELFRLLFVDPERSYHLRDVARLSGLAVGTIQREVAHLAEAGLILKRRDGNRLYFRANEQAPIFRELQGIALKTTGLVDQLSAAMDGAEGIDLAFVYGSFAEGKTRVESDVDLFVIGATGMRQLAPALQPVSEVLQREINPNIFSPESYSRKLREGDLYIQNVTYGPKLWIIGSENELRAMA